MYIFVKILPKCYQILICIHFCKNVYILIIIKYLWYCKQYELKDIQFFPLSVYIHYITYIVCICTINTNYVIYIHINIYVKYISVAIIMILFWLSALLITFFVKIFKYINMNQPGTVQECGSSLVFSMGNISHKKISIDEKGQQMACRRNAVAKSAVSSRLAVVYTFAQGSVILLQLKNISSAVQSKHNICKNMYRLLKRSVIRRWQISTLSRQCFSFLEDDCFRLPGHLPTRAAKHITWNDIC